MEMKRISPDSLCVSQIVSLVELAQGLASTPPVWDRLKLKLYQYDAWGFFDREELVGYGLVNGKSPYFSGSIQLVELRYGWQHNREPEIAEMIRSLARAYQNSADLMVLDVDIRRDINREVYRTLGFKHTMMHSPFVQGNAVLICDIKGLI